MISARAFKFTKTPDCSVRLYGEKYIHDTYSTIRLGSGAKIFIDPKSVCRQCKHIYEKKCEFRFEFYLD